MAIKISGTTVIDDSRELNVAGVSTLGTVKVSTGIVTARGGFEIREAGVGGTITAVGNAEFVGVVTASSFVGDGTGLAGVASTDNIITGTAATFTGGVNISGASNISITGIITATSFVGVPAGFTELDAALFN